LTLALAGLVALAVPAAAWEVDATATVTSVVDGDTFDCSPTGRVRLADVDAPEYYETGYQEAADYISSLIAGQTVYLDIDDVYGTDPYDRWVAVVYVRHNSTHLLNVNQAMLDAGHATVWDFENEFDPLAWSRYVFSPIDAPPPTVTASADVTEGFAPLTVSFASTASGGIPPYTYSWTFGDGGRSSAPNPSHTFRIGGMFSVGLTVTDAARRSSSQTVVVKVQPPVSVASSTAPRSGAAPLTVAFTATATGGSPPYMFLWAFGDSDTSTSPNPSHTYTVPGTYTATVTVADSGNRTDTESFQITVSAPPPTATEIPSAVIGAGAVGLAGVVAAGYVLLQRHRRRSR
jgi:PKD repeat protein